MVVYECFVAGCEKFFLTDAAALQHSQDSHSDFECRYCTARFSSAELLRQHFNKDHPHVVPKKLPLPCSVARCHRMFDDKGLLKAHLTTKHDMVPEDIAKAVARSKKLSVPPPSRAAAAQSKPISVSKTPLPPVAVAASATAQPSQSLHRAAPGNYGAFRAWLGTARSPVASDAAAPEATRPLLHLSEEDGAPRPYIQRFGTEWDPVVGAEIPDRVMDMSGARPYCAVCVGKQGSGKSNTLNCLVENAMLPNPPDRPCCTMALHFGSSYGCEVLGVCDRPGLHEACTVLVSPTNPRRYRLYKERGVRVRTLQFRWSSLSATHLAALMHLPLDDSPPLYAATMLAKLRDYQAREVALPSFAAFEAEFLSMESLMTLQKAALVQRFSVLRAFVADDDATAFDVGAAIANGEHLLIADLSDDFLAPSDASAIFFVLLNQFRNTDIKAMGLPLAGKLAILDEAHEFFTDHQSRLCGEVVSIAKVMRHLNVRIAVSTQLPTVVPPALFQLCSMALIHHLHTPSLWDALQREFDLTHADFEFVRDLRVPGVALAVGSDVEGTKRRIRVRARLTTDLGQTQTALH